MPSKSKQSKSRIRPSDTVFLSGSAGSVDNSRCQRWVDFLQAGNLWWWKRWVGMSADVDSDQVRCGGSGPWLSSILWSPEAVHNLPFPPVELARISHDHRLPLPSLLECTDKLVPVREER